MGRMEPVAAEATKVVGLENDVSVRITLPFIVPRAMVPDGSISMSIRDSAGELVTTNLANIFPLESSRKISSPYSCA
ncbi:MAG: hypothetical protein Rhob2KO_23130 [Rhodopirellula baltica]